MTTFRAVVVDKGEQGYACGFRDFDEAELMDGDVTVRVDALDGQLQGRPGAHRQGAGGAALPDDPGHRFRRHGGELEPSRLEAGRQGHPERLGRRRDASRRLCAQKARVKGDWLVPLPAGLSAARGHGDRHRRLHGHALRHGAGDARRSRPTAARSSSPARPAASARSRSRSWPSSAAMSSPRPGGRRRRTT